MAITADEEDGSWLDDISGLIKSGTAAYSAYTNRGDGGGGGTPAGPSYVPQSGMNTNTMLLIGLAVAAVLLVVLKKKG